MITTVSCPAGQSGAIAASSHTLNSLWELYPRCPRWQAKWEAAVAGVSRKDRTSYRGYTITRTKDGVSVSMPGAGAWATRVIMGEVAPKALFGACHADLALMVDTLAHARNKDVKMLAGLEKVLLAQFPGDAAWEQAIRHRVGMLRATGKCRKHDAAIYPRILAERRNALVLIKGHKGQWETKKGSSVDRVLLASGADRRKALFVLMGLPGLRRIELPTNLNFEQMLVVAEKLSVALKGRHPLVVSARKGERQWSLAVRRIQSMGLNGCFDAASQAIIVDPRHLDSACHELCHWLIGHDVAAPNVGDMRKIERQVHRLEDCLFRG